MEPGKSFAQRLRSGDKLLAISASLSPVMAEIMGRCDFDWLFLDAEYLPLTGPAKLKMSPLCTWPWAGASGN